MSNKLTADIEQPQKWELETSSEEKPENKYLEDFYRTSKISRINLSALAVEPINLYGQFPLNVSTPVSIFETSQLLTIYFAAQWFPGNSSPLPAQQLSLQFPVMKGWTHFPLYLSSSILRLAEIGIVEPRRLSNEVVSFIIANELEDAMRDTKTCINAIFGDVKYEISFSEDADEEISMIRFDLYPELNKEELINAKYKLFNLLSEKIDPLKLNLIAMVIHRTI